MTSVFLCLRKQRPRFAQGQPNGYKQTEELDRTTQPIARMSVEWNVEEAERAEFKVPTGGNIEFVSRAETGKFKACSGLHV